MTEKELRAEYENVLLGKKKNYSSSFFKDGAVDSNQKNALGIMKIAFERFLKWTPQDIYHYLNAEIITRMKLDALMKYIVFPGELDAGVDYFYIAHLIYPEQIRFDSQEWTIRVYKNILDKKLYRFPKNFWEGTEGVFRSKLCFKYMIQNYMIFHSIEDAYSFFAGDEGAKAIKKYHLQTPCDFLYEHRLDYLHNSLSHSQRDEFLYHYYKFCGIIDAELSA